MIKQANNILQMEILKEVLFKFSTSIEYHSSFTKILIKENLLKIGVRYNEPPQALIFDLYHILFSDMIFALHEKKYDNKIIQSN